MQEAFKLFHTIIQASAHMAQRFLAASNNLEDIVSITLIGMREQLHMHNKAWMTKVLPTKALLAFRALEGSLILSHDKEQFFIALKFATLKQQATGTKKPNKWSNHLGSSNNNYNSNSLPSSKGKKPYFKPLNLSTSSPGAGSGATQDYDLSDQCLSKKNSKSQLIVNMQLLNCFMRPPKFKFQSL